MLHVASCELQGGESVQVSSVSFTEAKYQWDSKQEKQFMKSEWKPLRLHNRASEVCIGFKFIS